LPKTYSDLTARILNLRVGASCAATSNHPDKVIKTARKYVPSGVWTIETVEGGKLVTRVR